MRKYEPLRQLLAEERGPSLTLSLETINGLVQGGLPASAYRHRPWWGNNPLGHSQAAAWLDAGWWVDDVDSAAGTVTFLRQGGRQPRSWSAAFDRQPAHWGLRGDPYVWEEMSRHLAHQPMPASRDEALRQLNRCFEIVVGVSVNDARSGTSVYVEKFAHGGMSSGHVDLQTWREKLLPMLANRIMSGNP